MAYTGVHQAHFEECVRLVPAIAKATVQSRELDVLSLFTGMLDEGNSRGIPNCLCWSIMTSATMSWALQLFQGAAHATDVPVEDLLDRAISASVNWVADGQ